MPRPPSTRTCRNCDCRRALMLGVGGNQGGAASRRCCCPLSNPPPLSNLTPLLSPGAGGSWRRRSSQAWRYCCQAANVAAAERSPCMGTGDEGGDVRWGASPWGPCRDIVMGEINPGTPPRGQRVGTSPRGRGYGDTDVGTAPRGDHHEDIVMGTLN